MSVPPSTFNIREVDEDGGMSRMYMHTNMASQMATQLHGVLDGVLDGNAATAPSC